MEDVREILEYQTNPVKVIREKCKDCTNNQRLEIENCTVKSCPLYPWRMGRNPYRKKRELTEEQKAVTAERMKRARGKKEAIS